MNKRGEVVITLTTASWYFLANIALVASAIVLTPSFRERKALQYCEQEGISNCPQFVSNMDKTELLAYIKDTQERPR
jgi:uncharacterized membrane protein